MKNYLSILILLFSSIVWGDAPLGKPQAGKVCGFYINYCAYLEPGQDTKVYSIGANFAAEFVYSIEGWHRAAFISLDGKYFVSGYSGLNLAPLDATEELEILTVYKFGKKHRVYKLGQILKSMKSLKRTSSHYSWGSFGGFYDGKSFHLKTVEDLDVIIDFESGKIYHDKLTSK